MSSPENLPPSPTPDESPIEDTPAPAITVSSIGEWKRRRPRWQAAGTLLAIGFILPPLALPSLLEWVIFMVVFGGLGVWAMFRPLIPTLIGLCLYTLLVVSLLINSGVALLKDGVQGPEPCCCAMVMTVIPLTALSWAAQVAWRGRTPEGENKAGGKQE